MIPIISDSHLEGDCHFVRLYDLPRWAVKPPLVAISEVVEDEVLHELEGLQV